MLLFAWRISIFEDKENMIQKSQERRRRRRRRKSHLRNYVPRETE